MQNKPLSHNWSNPVCLTKLHCTQVLKVFATPAAADKQLSHRRSLPIPLTWGAKHNVLISHHWISPIICNTSLGFWSFIFKTITCVYVAQKELVQILGICSVFIMITCINDTPKNLYTNTAHLSGTQTLNIHYRYMQFIPVQSISSRQANAKSACIPNGKTAMLMIFSYFSWGLENKSRVITLSINACANLNPFNAPSCQISRLKGALMQLQTVYFLVL